MPLTSKLRHLPVLWLWCFAGLSLLTVSFPHQLLPLPADILSPPFAGLAQLTGKLIGVDASETGVSDSGGMQVHFLNLLILALPAAALLSVALPRRHLYSFHALMFAVTRYFLAWQLLLYGFNKLFKCQFYLPEPNIQYSELRHLDKDILYWSAMGASRFYSLFLGGVEIVAGVLLFWRRTSLVGAIISTGILLNVLAVNIAFDISVKLHAGFLLLLALITIYPYRQRLAMLVTDTAASFERNMRSQRPKPLVAVKYVIILLILADALYPYIRAGNFNDDAMSRPPMHGAYKIAGAHPLRWKRFFIHRRGYFVLQDSAGAFHDYELNTDTAAATLWISKLADTDETALYYNWRPDSSLELSGWINGDSVGLTGRRLPLRGEEWQ